MAKNTKKKSNSTFWIGSGLALAIIVGLILFIGLSGDKQTIQAEAVHLSAHIQQASFTDVFGRSVSIGNNKGNVLLVNYWSKDCPACVQELPHLQKLYDTHYGSDFDIISFNLDRISAAELERYLQQNNITFPVVHTSAGYVIENTRISSTPTSDILDKEGNPVRRFVGIPRGTEMDDLIERLMAH